MAPPKEPDLYAEQATEQLLKVPELIRILEDLNEKVDDSHPFYGNYFQDYSFLKKAATIRYQQTGNLNFIISTKETLLGKITNKIYPYPVKIKLCWVAEKEITGKTVRKVFFIDDRFDSRKWTVIREVLEEFWFYDVIANNRRYWIFSQDELPLEEHTIEGTLVECDDMARIGLNKQLRINIPLLFVNKAKRRIIKYADHTSLFEEVKKLQLDEDKLFNWLFSNPDGKSYRHPSYFEKMIGALLFSAKRSGCPLHPLIISRQGTGKTYLEQSLHDKFKEQQRIVEGSGSTIKALVPSFKDVKPEAGAFPRSNRICFVDEFLRLLMRSRPENRENDLTMLNSLLEHQEREFASGNSRITLQPTAKMFGVTNPVYGLKDMVSLCETIDNSFIDREFVVFQTTDHIKWVREGKGIQAKQAEIPHMTWLSIYDYLQTFNCAYDETLVKKIAEMFEPFLADKVLDIYQSRYKNHHIHLLLDGIIKLRCLLEQDESFTAKEEDYDTLLKIWKTIILGWKGTNEISNLPSAQEKMRYLSREEIYLLEEVKKRGKIRDSDVYELDCPDPTFHMLHLQEINLVKKEGHYFLLNDQSQIPDH